MEQEVLIPQGTYRVGRDIPAGVYLITALNKHSCVTIADDYDEREWYALDEEHGNSCHFEVKKGDILKIEGKAKIKRITRFFTDTSKQKENTSRLSETDDSLYVSKTLADQWDINVQSFYHAESTRLDRGKQYLKENKVTSLIINKGTVKAKVLGANDNHYDVTVNIGMSEKDKKYSLPTKDKISFWCNCPDESSPCKHIAAVLYSISDKARSNPKVFDELL